jgi:hypothetical protein
VFVQEGTTVTTDDPTSPAADLAEQLVDEIAKPRQDWTLIGRLALELAAIARAAGATQRSRSTGADAS